MNIWCPIRPSSATCRYICMWAKARMHRKMFGLHRKRGREGDQTRTMVSKKRAQLMVTMRPWYPRKLIHGCHDMSNPWIQNAAMSQQAQSVWVCECVSVSMNKTIITQIWSDDASSYVPALKQWTDQMRAPTKRQIHSKCFMSTEHSQYCVLKSLNEYISSFR